MAKHYREGDNQGIPLKVILLVAAILNLVNR